MRTRRWVAAAAVTGVLIGLSGCGGGSDTADEGVLEAEAASSQPVESESPETESAAPEEQPGGYDAQELIDAMKAAVAEKESAHLTMAGGGQGMRGEGDVSYAGDDTAMQMQM